MKGEGLHADDQPADPQGSRTAEGQVEGPCDGAEPAEARSLHPRLHDDPEEAELGAAQGGQGSPDQPARSDQLYPRRGPQPPGAQRRADPRRPCARPSRRPLSRASRRARHAGCQGSPAVALQVRRQASQITTRVSPGQVPPEVPEKAEEKGIFQWLVVVAQKSAKSSPIRNSGMSSSRNS